MYEELLLVARLTEREARVVNDEDEREINEGGET